MGFDATQLINTFGYLGLVAIIFAESGLFFGLFLPLPGDTLLLSAGLLAARGKLDLWVLLVILPLAAIAGDTVGYWFGKKTGHWLFNRECSRFFQRKHLLAARAFYARHGGKTIVVARFVPLIRTFAPIVAGAADMHYPHFLFFNAAGGILWAAGMTAAGYFLGQSVPDLDRYFLIGVLAVSVISALAAVAHLGKELGPQLRDVLTGRLAVSQCSPDADVVPD